MRQAAKYPPDLYCPALKVSLKQPGQGDSEVFLCEECDHPKALIKKYLLAHDCLLNSGSCHSFILLLIAASNANSIQVRRPSVYLLATICQSNSTGSSNHRGNIGGITGYSRDSFIRISVCSSWPSLNEWEPNFSKPRFS